jgi:hypothetical protein
MAANLGPKIIKSGLVFDLDAADRNSYPGSITGDPKFSNCSILMHCNGNNGSTTFIDNSPTPKTVTANGNAQISTTQSKFGGASAYFDGTGDYLSTNTSSDFAFGTGDFTVECWIYSSDVSGSTQRGFLQTSDTSGGLKTSYTTGIVIAQGSIVGGAALTGALIANVAGTAVSSSVAVITTNTWYHIALVRLSGTSTLYVNGTSVGSATTAGNCSGTYLAIGGYYNTSFLYQGYLDELRITKGVARYTSNFTVQSEEFPNQLPQWIDLSGNNNNGSLTNSPAFNALNGGSIVFDGTDDYVNCGNSSSVQINQGTICAWAKTTNTVANYFGILIKVYNYGLFLYGGNLATYDWGNSVLRSSGVSIADGKWKYLSISFTNNVGSPSNNAIFYINGVAVLTFTMKWFNDTSPLIVGMGGLPASPSQLFPGNIACTQVYNKLLTATEILQNYNAVKSRFGL